MHSQRRYINGNYICEAIKPLFIKINPTYETHYCWHVLWWTEVYNFNNTRHGEAYHCRWMRLTTLPRGRVVSGSSVLTACVIVERRLLWPCYIQSCIGIRPSQWWDEHSLRMMAVRTWIGGWCDCRLPLKLMMNRVGWWVTTSMSVARPTSRVPRSTSQHSPLTMIIYDAWTDEVTTTDWQAVIIDSRSPYDNNYSNCDELRCIVIRSY